MRCPVALLLGGLLLTSLSAAQQTIQLPEEIFKHWLHSHEEDGKGVKVYRPADFKFPPARGRTGFEIKKNGDFIWHDIAPADGNVQVPGKWKAEAAGRIVASFPMTKRPPLTLQIVSFDGKVLKVKE